MTAADRDHVKLLHGPYRMPRCRIGSKLRCKVRGLVTVVGFSRGPVPWPMTHSGKPASGRPVFILCGDLLKAIRRESSKAIQQWLGVGPIVVARWRRVLGVPWRNPGTARLHRERVTAARAAQPRRPLSIEQRRKLSETHRRLKQHPPTVRPWQAAEDRILGQVSDREVSKRTGRSLLAVEGRRHRLRIPSFGAGVDGDGRRRMKPVTARMRKAAELHGTM